MRRVTERVTVRASNPARARAYWPRIGSAVARLGGREEAHRSPGVPGALVIGACVGSMTRKNESIVDTCEVDQPNSERLRRVNENFMMVMRVWV